MSQHSGSSIELFSYRKVRNQKKHQPRNKFQILDLRKTK